VQGLHRGVVADIGDQGEMAVAGQRGARGFGALADQVHAGDARACTGEAMRQGEAEAAAGAGDQDASLHAEADGLR